MSQHVRTVGESIKFWILRPFFVWFTFPLKVARLTDFIDGPLGEKDNKGNTKITRIIEALEHKTVARAMAPDLFKLLDHVLNEHAMLLTRTDKAYRWAKLLNDLLAGKDVKEADKPERNGLRRRLYREDD